MSTTHAPVRSSEDNHTVIGSADKLRSDGRLIGKIGQLPVLVVWHEGAAYAIEDRCPHLGFPLHRGSIDSGLVTCHWHHARFDLASGCTLDPWADDATAFDVEIVGDDVLVSARSGEDVEQRWSRRLLDGLQHGLTLVIAKSVHALMERPDGQRTILATAYEFGHRNRADGWGSGMTVLTCLANLLPHLEEGDRPLALVHALSFLSADTRGNPPRFAQPPLSPSGQAPDRLAAWYRRSIDTRVADGAERVLATAVALGAPVEPMMFAAATDHVYLDGGHTVDFTNKAFEAIAVGAPSEVLGSLVRQTTVGERSEESNEWNHPIDLSAVMEPLMAVVSTAVERRPDDGIDVAATARGLLDDDPIVVAEVLQRAAETASLEQLARAVAYAAALRQLHFHLNNDPSDWNTVHHTLTYANAVHQAVTRSPTAELARGVVHGAFAVYLDRFLNVPAARVPAPTGDAATLASCWESQGHVEEAAAAVLAIAGDQGGRQRVIAGLGMALLQEDAQFHWYQNVEAATIQALAWPDGSTESSMILAAAARFLAAHTPTRRELRTMDRTAVRLRRGESLFEDEAPG